MDDKSTIAMRPSLKRVAFRCAAWVRRRGLPITLMVALSVIVLISWRLTFAHPSWQSLCRSIHRLHGNISVMGLNDSGNSPLFRRLPNQVQFLLEDWPQGCCLHLDHDAFDDGWLQRYGEPLKRCRCNELRLWNRSVTDRGLAALRDHSTLRELDAFSPRLSPDCILGLGILPELQRLRVDVPLSEASLRQLARWPELKQLMFSALQAEDLRYLSELSQLESLTLTVDDDAIERLPLDLHCRELSLHGVNVTDKSVPRLLELQVPSIVLRAKEISPEGMDKLRADGRFLIVGESP